MPTVESNQITFFMFDDQIHLKVNRINVTEAKDFLSIFLFDNNN